MMKPSRLSMETMGIACAAVAVSEAAGTGSAIMNVNLRQRHLIAVAKGGEITLKEMHGFASVSSKEQASLSPQRAQQPEQSAILDCR